MISKILSGVFLLTSSLAFTFPINAGFEEEGEVLNISVKKLMRASQKGRISVQGIRCSVENFIPSQLDAVSKEEEPLKVSLRKKEGVFHFSHQGFSLKITPSPMQNAFLEIVQLNEEQCPILTGTQLEKGYREGRLDTNHGRFSVASSETPHFDKLYDKTRKFYGTRIGKEFMFEYTTKFNTATGRHEEHTPPSCASFIAISLRVKKIN